jgi:hypothetical protein
MFEQEAAALLQEVKTLLDALHARPPCHERAVISARIWFSLEHAWALLTGAQPTGARTLH